MRIDRRFDVIFVVNDASCQKPSGRIQHFWDWDRDLLAVLVLMFCVAISACSPSTPVDIAAPSETEPNPSKAHATATKPGDLATATAVVTISAEEAAATWTPLPTLTMAPSPSPSWTNIPTPSRSPTGTSVPPSSTPACVEAQGYIETGFFYSAVIGSDQPYRVYLPPCYAHKGERYPVLYMLHGYPFDDSHWDDIGIDEAANAGIASGTLPPFIIAMPTADNEGTFTRTSGGPGSFEAVVLEEFVAFIEATYRTQSDSKGRAIGGMSRGGVWSLEIAFRNPDKFAAVGGHSAALNVNLAPPIYDPLYLASDPAIRALRIFLDTGRDDWVLPGMEDLHLALTGAGVVHDFFVFEGDHEDDYWAAHVAEYLAFYAADW